MKIGIYGGAFSPPHLGHINAAKEFKNKVNLDVLYIVPTGLPPHKHLDGFVTNEDRLNMARLAFSSFSTISSYELENDKISYTIDTLKYFKNIYPNDELYILIGDDMLSSFDTWYKPEEILNIATVCYIYRGGDKSIINKKLDQYYELYKKSFIEIKTDTFVISSSQVRNSVKDNCCLDQLLSRDIIDYIMENRLYYDYDK